MRQAQELATLRNKGVEELIMELVQLGTDHIAAGTRLEPGFVDLIFSNQDAAVSNVEEMAENNELTAEEKLAQARSLMLSLGEGLGESDSPHDGARNHDLYLYS